MAINHVTLLKIKADVPPRDVDDVFVEVRALLRQIPGVVGIGGGRIFDGQSSDYTHAGFTTIKDHEALEVFKSHPLHDEARRLLGPFVIGGTAFDYEIDDT